MAVPRSGHTINRINSLVLSSIARKSASKAVLSRMQLILHATRRTHLGASRLVEALSTWSVKTRRAPSRHCRDARAYGHATTAMHDNEYTPPHNMILSTPTPVICIFTGERNYIDQDLLLCVNIGGYMVLRSIVGYDYYVILMPPPPVIRH